MRRVVGDGPAQRSDLVGDRPRALVQAGSSRRLDQRRRRQRVQTQASLRALAGADRNQAPPRERVEQHPLRRRASRAFRQLAGSAEPELEPAPASESSAARKRSSARRLAGVIRAPQRIASTVANCRSRADIDEIVQPPHPHALGQRPAAKDPVAQRDHLVGGGMPERGVAVLDVVVQRLGRRTRSRRARAPSTRSSGRGSGRTAPEGTAARGRAGRAGTARRRR